MNKQLIIAFVFSISAFSFAQKKELKSVEKAIKGNNFAEAKTALIEVEGLMSSMDEDMKSKYYYLNGIVLYDEGKGNQGDFFKALESLKKAKGKYKSLAEEMNNTIYNDFITKGNEAIGAKDYKKASSYFENAYSVKSIDTSMLYYAATTAVNVKDYDRALGFYEELKQLNYTGIEKQYFATDKETGKEVVLNKATRDIYVTAGTHIKPGERMTESRKPEIVKNVALIYVSQGKQKEALAAIKDARIENPDNVDLIINEANIYLGLKDNDKFKSLIEEALVKDPNNEVLHYNVGIVTMNKGNLDDAKTSFEKALSLKPDYSDAAINLSHVYIERGNILIEEMGKLGMSKADDVKYEKLKAEKNVLFQKGAEILTDFIVKNPSPNSNILYQLKNIYGALGETAKAKEIGSKIDAMVGGE